MGGRTGSSATPPGGANDCTRKVVPMDVFELRNRLIRDYAAYVSSFIQIRIGRIREYVDRCLQGGLLWPEPLIQLNPSLEPGLPIDEMAAAIRTGLPYCTLLNPPPGAPQCCHPEVRK